MLTDINGQKVQSYLFKPYGESWVVENPETPNTNEITRKFTGQEFDQETGLYYMNARYYDPKIGMFLAPDPAMSGLNHYAYCSANPIRYTDPTGLSEEETGISNNDFDSESENDMDDKILSEEDVENDKQSKIKKTEDEKEKEKDVRRKEAEERRDERKRKSQEREENYQKGKIYATNDKINKLEEKFNHLWDKFQTNPKVITAMQMVNIIGRINFDVWNTKNPQVSFDISKKGYINIDNSYKHNLIMSYLDPEKMAKLGNEAFKNQFGKDINRSPGSIIAEIKGHAILELLGSKKADVTNIGSPDSRPPDDNQFIWDFYNFFENDRRKWSDL